MQRKRALTILSGQVGRLRRQYGLAHLSIFGSVARGESRPGSDVDVLVEFSHPLSLFELAQVKTDLESSLGCKVDLATPARIGPRLRRNIEHDLIRVA